MEQEPPEETLSAYLDRLAGRSTAPAGGASAGLHTAQSAALITMVGRFCADQEDHAVQATRIVERASSLRTRALRLMYDDEVAYSGVATASPPDRSAALVVASRPQAQLLDMCDELIELGVGLVPAVRRRTAPDLAAALLAARTGAQISAINVLANLAGVEATGATEARQPALKVNELLERCDELVTGLLVRCR